MRYLRVMLSWVKTNSLSKVIKPRFGWTTLDQRRFDRNPIVHCKFPMPHIPSICVMSSFERNREQSTQMAACFRTVKENQDDFEIMLAHLTCVKMICREIHVSFVNDVSTCRIVASGCRWTQC